MSNSVVFKKKEIKAGGFNTAYLEAGNPQHPTLVLVHDGAYGTTAELCWGPMIASLAAHFHVLAPDLLGWGGTDKVTFFDRSPYAFRVVHLLDWCRAVGVSRAHFAGASFGGSLILRALTSAGAAFPASKVISISGTGGPFRLASGIQALAEYEPSLEAAERLTALLVPDTSKLTVHIQQRYENSLIPGHWETLSAPRLHNPALSKAPPKDNLFEALEHVSRPVLFIEGTRDVLLEPGWADALSSHTPGSEVLKLDHGHEPNINAPDELAREMLRFLLEGDAFAS
jgi:pimeloyl-ACP methyl ester carboxylesterase